MEDRASVRLWRRERGMENKGRVLWRDRRRGGFLLWVRRACWW